METSGKLSKATNLDPASARPRIGLAVLLGGSLLALVVWMISALAGGAPFADAAHSVHDEGAPQALSSVDPPCGVLDGVMIDSLEVVGDWCVITGSGAISATLMTVTGHAGQALQLSYNLGITPGAWVQLRRDFSPSLDLSAGDHLRFFHRGTTSNTLEVGLVSAAGENYFGSPWDRATHVPTWTYATWNFRDFRKEGHPLPALSQVKAIFISVKKDGGDSGGTGSFMVDELQYLNVASRTVPSEFEPVTASPTVTQRAADWVADQQQPGGLLKSWREESADYAWLYDQALGLIVLSESGHITGADRLAVRLHELQHPNGYWYAGYHYLDGTEVVTTTPVGANAWTAYALTRYGVIRHGPSLIHADAYVDARECAGWLASLQRDDGSLPALPGETTAPTEPNLDAWWAFQATGYCTQAQRLQNLLLGQVWDPQIGRFKSSPDTYQIFLDNQTWGAALLSAIHREDDARRALSYARWTLGATSFDGAICGFDGAGPFSVWNEGTLQYVAARGENSPYYWEEMISQQALDGSLPGSPDGFQGYIVWLTPMRGVAPTSWLYFAGTGGPFHVAPYCASSIYLPLILRNHYEYEPYSGGSMVIGSLMWVMSCSQ